MVNSNKLIGLFAERGFTRGEIARKLKISDNTLRRKLEIGKFDSDEMYTLIKTLGIADPTPIFFADDGTYHVPNSDSI